MSYTHYDRLSALDSSFLENESHASHMHVGSVGLFDAKPLRAAHGGGLDQERILAACETGAAHNTRFRQKLALVPLFGSPVWIDDEHFNLNYHIRFTALPAPGDIRQLKRLTGRIMSTQLDRGKPLWEIWFIEGLAGIRCDERAPGFKRFIAAPGIESGLKRVEASLATGYGKIASAWATPTRTDCAQVTRRSPSLNAGAKRFTCP